MLADAAWRKNSPSTSSGPTEIEIWARCTKACQIANLWQVRLMNSDVSTIARRVRDQADALPDLFGRFDFDKAPERWAPEADAVRSEEHTSELQSLMRISYAVFCLKKKKNTTHNKKHTKRIKKSK